MSIPLSPADEAAQAADEALKATRDASENAVSMSKGLHIYGGEGNDSIFLGTCENPDDYVYVDGGPGNDMVKCSDVLPPELLEPDTPIDAPPISPLVGMSLLLLAVVGLIICGILGWRALGSR